MQYLRGIESYCDAGKSAVTFGKFDGLHCGHQKLIDQVKEFGEKDEIKSVVCAFDMSLLGKEGVARPPILMTKKERRRHLENQVDILVDYPFSESLRMMDAESFIKGIICEVFHADYVVVGTDFCFGHEKRGDIHMLQAYAKKYNYELVVLDKERYEGKIISSTCVRQTLQTGNLSLANTLLGYAYGIEGVVEHGKKLGRTLGFPTFNVAPPREKMMPPNGVYLNRVYVDERWYNGIANIGVKPTVTNEDRLLVESYLFDYEGEAYGKQVQIELTEFIRPEQRFSSIEEMKLCVNKDIELAKQRL